MLGEAGARVVLEECLQGEEVSFLVLSDGERVVPMVAAQDHKRVFDDDRGPNTGGMGAFAPSPLVDAALDARVMKDIIDPVIAGMAAEGHPFRLIVSLSSAKHEQRLNLLPIERTHPLPELMAAVREYHAATRKRVTLAWTVMTRGQ